MFTIDLKTANKIIEAGIQLRREAGHLPLTFCVLDRGGHLVAAQREDDSSIMRFEIAFGKAWASLALGHSTHFQETKMAPNRPHFIDSLAAVSNGRFVPALGGVLIRELESNTLLGALGVTGDWGENDEQIAIKAIEKCGFKADLT